MGTENGEMIDLMMLDENACISSTSKRENLKLSRKIYVASIYVLTIFFYTK